MTKLKEDLQKIKGMSFKEAADHIYTYYGLIIAAIIFALIFIISLISTVVKNKLTVPVIQVAVQNEIEYFYGDDMSLLLSETFPDAKGYNEPFKCTFSSSADTTDMYAGIQLMAYIAAGDIDAVICDQATADYICGSGEGAIVTDLSDTRLGKKAADIGISPLFYITYEDWKNKEAADLLLNSILTEK